MQITELEWRTALYAHVCSMNSNYIKYKIYLQVSEHMGGSAGNLVNGSAEMELVVCGHQEEEYLRTM